MPTSFESRVRGQRVRRAGGELAEEPEDVAGARRGMEDRSGQDGRPDLVQAVLEGGDDAEVAAASPEAPEEVRVLALAGAHEARVGRHHVRGHQVVAGQAEAAIEPADAAAEREARDAGGRDHAAGRRQAERLGLAVELAPRHAGPGPRGPVHRVDPDALHGRQVDHEATVAHGAAGDVVAAAPHGHEHVVLAREAHGGQDVGDAGAARDERRAPVDHGVVDGAGRVVAGVAGPQQAATELLGEARDRPRVHLALLFPRWAHRGRRTTPRLYAPSGRHARRPAPRDVAQVAQRVRRVGRVAVGFADSRDFVKWDGDTVTLTGASTVPRRVPR
jgi:hypothetical protein